MKTRMTTGRRTAGLIGAAALTFALAACGDDDAEVTTVDGSPTTEDTTDTGDDPTEDTTEDTTTDTGDDTTEDTTDTGDDTTEDTTTEDTGGGTASEGEEVDPQAFADRLASPGEATLSAYSFEMTMSIEGQEMSAEGHASGIGDEMAMQLSMYEPSMGMTIELIVVDGDFYMAMPPLTEPGKYILMPGDELIGFDELDQVDVTSQFDEFGDAASIRFVGNETVDGENLERFELDLNDGGVSGTVDLWLDSSNLVRQVTFDEAEGAITMKIFDWGQPKEVTAPAPEDVQDASDFGF